MPRDRPRRTPLRPSLPLLAFPALLFWLGLRLGEGLSWGEYADQGAVHALAGWLSIEASLALWLLVAAVCMAAACLALGFSCAFRLDTFRLSRRVSKGQCPSPWLFAMMAGGLALGLLAGSLAWGAVCAQARGLQGSSGPYVIEVTGDPVQGSFSNSSSGVLHASSGISSQVKIVWEQDEEALPAGMAFEARGTFSPIACKAAGERMFQNLQCGTFRPRAIERSWWPATPQGIFGELRHRNLQMLRQRQGPGEAIVEGVVFGNRELLTGTELDGAFKVTGLSHLLAVSGSHLTVVAMLVSWALGVSRFSRRASIAILACIVVSYLLLSGLHASAARACVMALLASGSWYAGRRAHALSGLSAAVVGLLLFDPANAFSLGFELSVLGVVGLCLFMPLVTQWMAAIMPARAEKLADPLSMTLTAQAATLPASVPVFGMLSVGGALCNLIVSPLITLLLGGGLISMALYALCPWLGEHLISALCVLGDATAYAVSAMAGIPHMAVPAYLDSGMAWAVALALAIGLWIWWPQPTKRLLHRGAALLTGALLVIIVFAQVPAAPGVVMLDVGQGDAILVRDGASSVLIDTGKSDALLRAALGRNGIGHLDALVITHFDQDHCASLGVLASLVTVDEVVVAEGSLKAAQGKGEGSTAEQAIEDASALVGAGGICEMGCGQVMRLSKHMTLEMVWPRKQVEGSSNANSLCLLLRYDCDCDGNSDFSMLLTGDAERDELHQIARAGVGPVDVLKVGHHGSKVALDDDALDALEPKVALISVGAENSYGHPNEQILSILAEHGVRIWRTDQSGDVTLSLRNGSYEVHGEHV